jgi:hypothetical protein
VTRSMWLIPTLQESSIRPSFAWLRHDLAGPEAVPVQWSLADKKSRPIPERGAAGMKRESEVGRNAINGRSLTGSKCD